MLIPRLIGCLIFLFLSPMLTGQPVHHDDDKHIAAAPGAVAVAQQTPGAARVVQFQQALVWYGRDSFAMCRTLVDSLVHDTDGKLIADSLSGLAYHMAGMSYYEVYDDANAVPQYLRAIRIRDACYADPHKDQAHTRYNLANSMHWMGRPDTAVYLLREAIDIYDQLPQKDTTNWLRSLKLLGVIARESNDRELTRNATLAMVDLLGRYTKPTLIDRYQMYYDAAVAFQYLKEYVAGAKNAEKAVVAARLMDDSTLEADAINVASVNRRLAGDPARARQGHREALRLLAIKKDVPSSFGITHLNLSEAAYAEGKYESALAFAQKAFAYPVNPDYPHSAADKFFNMAKVLEALDRDEAAMRQYTEAMSVLAGAGIKRNGPNPLMEPDSIVDIPMAIDLYTRRADLLIKKGRFPEALLDMEQVFALQDLQRQGVSSAASRYALSAEVWPYYDRAIGLHYDLYQRTNDADHLWQAFRLSESARAYSQLAALGRRRLSMGRREQDLRRNIARLERTVNTDPTADVRRADQQLRLELILRSEQRQSLTVQTAPDRQALFAFLKEHQTDLVEYHVGTDRGFVFYLSADGNLAVYLLPGAETLRELTDRWRTAVKESAYRSRSLRSPEAQKALDEAYLRGGLKLREQLLPMFAGAASVATRLCIVPDGALHFLPFAALPLADAALPLNYAKLPYLNDRVEIQLAFSARYLLELNARPIPAYEQDLLAFAPSFGGKATVGEVSRARSARAERVLAGANTGESLPGLLPLTYNRAEVEAIAKLVARSETYLDDKAALSTFLRTLGSERILHLSSHGMVNPTDPNLSFVAFAQQHPEMEEAELLFFNDLSTLPLFAELVVLSACETSLGPVAPGETVLSLGAAFSAAGARSTLTTLWQVSDAATRDLMVAFYGNLTAGQSRSKSLQAAQEQLLKEGEYAHPYYWSGMTLNGEVGPISFTPSPLTAPWWLYLLAAAALAGMCWVGFRK